MRRWCGGGVGVLRGGARVVWRWCRGGAGVVWVGLGVTATVIDVK